MVYCCPMSGVDLRFQILKSNDERRLVTAWFSVVTKADGETIVDSQHDMIDINDLEEAVNEMFSSGGLRKGGEMHDVIGGADIVQVFTLSADEREALGFGAGPEGGFMKARVTNDALWARIKSGELSELSIGGEGVRVPA